jgi:hypothetical protein
MDVEDRENVKKHILWLPSPGFVKSFEIGDQVAMRDLRTFGSSGRSAGVDDNGGIGKIRDWRI